MNTPFFSVILNTYNNEVTIKKTLSSIIGQNFRDFELIVVDDASQDDTVNIVKKILGMNNIRFKIFPLKNNCGVAHSRNVGIDNAQGKYLAFIDGDDLWRQNKLYIQYQFLNKSLFKLLFSNYSVVDNEYNLLGQRVRDEGIYDFNRMISSGNPVGMLTVVVERNLINKYRFRNVRHEDYDLWLRMTKSGIPGYLLSQDLALYMKHESLSSNKLKSIKWTYNVFRQNGVSIVKSYYLIVKYGINYIYRQMR